MTNDEALKMAQEIVARHLSKMGKHFDAVCILRGEQDNDDEMKIAIAAIMAERKRCAGVARLAMVENPDADELTCSICAAAIRNTGGE